MSEITTAEAYVLQLLYDAENRATETEAAYLELKRALTVAVQAAVEVTSDAVEIPGHAFAPLRDLLLQEAQTREIKIQE